jgi:AcrR family transcriptional regulator
VGKPSHDRILAAAERVFAERGFGSTSLRDLMAAAECSTTAFYARFASKEAVLEALVRQLLTDLHDAAAAELPRAKTLVAGWDVGVDVLVDTVRDRKGLVRVALTEAGQEPAARAVLRQAYGLLAALLAAQLERPSRRKAGAGRDVARARAWALVGALTMQVTRWAVFEELADDALADALRDVARPLLPARRAPARR